jgi:hypothetical protein
VVDLEVLKYLKGQVVEEVVEVVVAAIEEHAV